ncbi:MAG: hypothetical protein H6905_00745 [Hyphomicrobiales bacterium]|nr:hypothetical protein [Hyphomicrobiales bacterium]
MTRIANNAANSHLQSLIMRTQERVNTAQTQMATEKVSQDYTGLSQDTRRLLSLENARVAANQFKKGNDLMKLRLDIADTALESIDTTVRDFRAALLDQGGNDPLDQDQVRDMQTYAFRALQEMESALNAKADGQYVFSGSRVRTEPVDFGLTTLEDFQARFDGRLNAYPDSRDAHLADFSLDPGGNWLTFEQSATAPAKIRVSASTAEVLAMTAGTRIDLAGTPTGTYDGTFSVRSVGTDGTGTYIEVEEERFFDEGPLQADIELADGTALDFGDMGNLTFDGTADTVTAAIPDAFAGVAVGTVFTVSGTTSNDGVFEVTANDGTTMTIQTHKLPDSATVAVAGTLSSQSYYHGDQISRSHRIDENQSFSLDIDGVDPAFEKAIRAMAMIAQGAYGTTGGLEHHADRIGEAIDLLSSALDPAAAANAQLQGELSGNLGDVRAVIGFNQVAANEASTRQSEFIANLEMQIADIENVDTFEAAAQLLAHSNTLEASYQALARIQQLSLSNFL